MKSKFKHAEIKGVITVMPESRISVSEEILLSAFGVGLSWGSAIVNFKNAENLGIRFMKNKSVPSREEMTEQWINYFKGE